MHDGKRREIGRHRAAEVVLVIAVRNDVHRRPVQDGDPREGVVHDVGVDRHDRGGVPDHTRLEPALELGQRRGPTGRVVIVGPGITEVGNVRYAKARGDRVRDEDRSRRERGADYHVPARGAGAPGRRPHREGIPEGLGVGDHPRLRVKHAPPRRRGAAAAPACAGRRCPAVERRELGGPRADHLGAGHLGEQRRILGQTNRGPGAGQHRGAPSEFGQIFHQLHRPLDRHVARRREVAGHDEHVPHAPRPSSRGRPCRRTCGSAPGRSRRRRTPARRAACPPAPARPGGSPR